MGLLRSPGAILLVSCYELGRQPVGVAFPRAFLERAGFEPDSIDIAVEAIPVAKLQAARLVAISVPMHTAMRLGMRLAQRIRSVQPSAHICFYGLYAFLNAEYLLANGADSCIGGEYEGPLVALAESLDRGSTEAPPTALACGDGRGKSAAPTVPLPAGVIGNGDGHPVSERWDGLPRPSVGHGRAGKPVPNRGIASLERLEFPVPSRRDLPPLTRYARLEHGGRSRLAGAVEASRGCRHRCRHCPIPPVYGGRFFVVPTEVVLADVRQLVAAGAEHITFADPDFLNGPQHALRTARAFHAEFPTASFDFTAKVEHLVRQARLLPELAECGCLFVISAVESLNGRILDILDKGHTRADVETALAALRRAGIALRPTWIPFTPWATREDYRAIFEFVHSHDLVDHVDPVQYTIRLLVPPGSWLAEHPAMRPHLGKLDPSSFGYRWEHPDPAMDRLQADASELVERAARDGTDPDQTFHRLWTLAGGPDGSRGAARRARAPRMTEPWFC